MCFSAFSGRLSMMGGIEELADILADLCQSSQQKYGVRTVSN